MVHVFPESDIVARIMRVLTVPGVADIRNFAGGRIKVFSMDIEASSSLAGQSWRIYLYLTATLMALLMAAGMEAFDTFCHALSTLATGGFSTRTASIAAFASPLAEYIIVCFMREFRRVTEPQGVFRIRMGGGPVAETTVSALVDLVFLALLTLLVASLVLTASGVDLVTAVSAVVACQFNIGPGLAGVGPLAH